MATQELQSPLITVRRGLPADACRIAEVHVRSWQAAYRGLLPDAYLDSLDTEKRIPTWERLLHDPEQVIFVVEAPAAGVIGFATLSPPRDVDADPNTAELSSLYLAPQYWRRGGGTALVQALLTVAESRQCSAVTLWVLASNSRARRFYEKCGFTPDGAEKTEHRSPVLVIHEVRYRLGLPYCDQRSTGITSTPARSDSTKTRTAG